MSAKTKLAGKLPGDEPVNGVDYLAEGLCERFDESDPANPPAVLIVGVARVRKYETIRSDDGHIRVPTLEISRLEALGVLGRDPMGSFGLASQKDQQLLLKVAEARTGSDPLPIDAVSGDDNHQVLGDD